MRSAPVANGRAFLSRKVSRMLQEDHIEKLRSKDLDDTFECSRTVSAKFFQCVAEGRRTRKSPAFSISAHDR